MLGHSAITYLVGWKGVQASEQLVCGLIEKKRTWQEVINPLLRFFLHTQALNNQKWAAPLAITFQRFWRIILIISSALIFQTPPQSADCVWQLIN